VCSLLISINSEQKLCFRDHFYHHQEVIFCDGLWSTVITHPRLTVMATETFNFHSKCMLFISWANFMTSYSFLLLLNPTNFNGIQYQQNWNIWTGINFLCLNHLPYTFTSPCTNLIHTAESNWTCQGRETRIVICLLLWNTSTALWIWYVTLCQTDSRHAFFWIKLTVRSFQVTGSAKYGFIIESHWTLKILYNLNGMYNFLF
jgi:hypothetical protein